MLLCKLRLFRGDPPSVAMAMRHPQKPCISNPEWLPLMPGIWETFSLVGWIEERVCSWTEAHCVWPFGEIPSTSFFYVKGSQLFWEAPEDLWWNSPWKSVSICIIWVIATLQGQNFLCLSWHDFSGFYHTTPSTQLIDPHSLAIRSYFNFFIYLFIYF